MRIKKYVGETVQDVIFKIKAELGPDAIILNTHKLKKGGILGMFTKDVVEVVAGVEEKRKQEKDSNLLTVKDINDLKTMIQDMHNQWQTDKFRHDLSEELTILYQYLNRQGVAREYNIELIKLIKKEANPEQDLLLEIKRIIGQYLGESQPIMPGSDTKVVAFIGPTGVGKTTTIAKLSARFALDEKKRVCLITADTYRIAAVQQLRTYSEIINIPLHVIYNQTELLKLVNEDLKDNYDLILLDTVGTSWNDRIQLGKLKKLMTRDIVNETHLIIGLNTKSRVINEIINEFSILSPDKLLLTKLDETVAFGDIINLKNKYKFPFSYITFGQDVPDDIRPAAPNSLTDYLLGDLNV